MRARLFSLALAAPLMLLACAAQAQSADLPFRFERFALPGPMAGAVVKLDLGDPRVEVQVALADEDDPDGDGPCTGKLDTVSSVARKRDFAIALNASFFAAPHARNFQGRNYSYIVGNCTYPNGWHYSGGKQVSAPARAGLRATMIVHTDGRISLADNVQALPADTRYAVSGSAMVLSDGVVTPPASDAVRHPRSAVGLSADGKTLFLVAVDGRQDGHSRGATLAELGLLLQSLGAQHAINLDGGGSTAMVVKDPAIGTYSLVNRPSDQSTLRLPIANERPVADVIGVKIRY